MIAGLLVAGFFPEVWGEHTLWYNGLLASILSGTVPALFLALFAIAGKIITKKEVLGWGEVKYILTAGVLTGFAGAFFSLFFASFTGTVYGAVMALVGKKPFSRVKIPLGPFLATGTLIWIFAGKFFWNVLWMFKFN